MCISGYIFRTEYAGRIVNIIMSAIITIIIHDMTFDISNNHKTAIKAAKMYSYFPTTVIFSCFPFKDVYITLSVFFTFQTIIHIQKGEKLSIKRMIINTFLLIGLYYSRGAITELLIIFILLLFVFDSLKKKKRFRLCLAILITLLSANMFTQSVILSFTKKLNDYFYTDFARNVDSTIALIRIDSFSQIWKLPFAYIFALLNPFTMNWFEPAKSGSVWAYLYSMGNIVAYPIAIGNVYYFFKHKRNLYIWMTSLVMYLSVVIMSLGISRHYFFLYPMSLVNYSLFTEEARTSEKNNVMIGAAILSFLVMLISIARIL